MHAALYLLTYLNSWTLVATGTHGTYVIFEIIFNVEVAVEGITDCVE